MHKNEIFPILELIRKTITNCEKEDVESDLSLFNGKTSMSCSG